MTALQIFQQAINEPAPEADYTMHLIEIGIMLAGSFLLGYLLQMAISRKHVLENRKLKATILESTSTSTSALQDQKTLTELETKISQLEQRNSDLRIKLTSLETSSMKSNLLNQKNQALEEMVEKLQARITELETSPSSLQPAQPASTRIIPDSGEEQSSDLKKIEGIGPKISEVLNNAGIKTYADLAARTPEQIRAILLAEGTQYKVHNPTTWPRQAEMARDGKWDELDNWQHELTGGKPE